MLRKLFPKKTERPTDEALLLHYRESGDNVAVGELYQRYTHLAFGVCMKYLKNEAAAQDAVLQIFEFLLEKLLTEEVENFKAWLYQVTRNHCLMQLRKEKRLAEKQEAYKKTALTDMESERMQHPIEEEAGEQHLQQLSEAMESLPEEQRQCIELFFLQEQSYQQIADRTGYSLKQVKSYLQNGKRNLKKQLLAMGMQALLIGFMLWLLKA